MKTKKSFTTISCLERSQLIFTGQVVRSLNFDEHNGLWFIFRQYQIVHRRFSTDVDKRRSYRRGTARRPVSIEILSANAQLYKNTIWKYLQWVIDFDCHSSSSKTYRWNILYNFLLVAFSNKASILHRFRHSTTFIVYINVSDLEKFFSFDKTDWSCKLRALSDSCINML